MYRLKALLATPLLFYFFRLPLTGCSAIPATMGMMHGVSHNSSEGPPPFAKLSSYIQKDIDEAKVAGTAANQAVYMAHRVVSDTTRVIKNGPTPLLIKQAKKSAKEAAQYADQAKTLADQALTKVSNLTKVTKAKDRMQLTSKLKDLTKHLRCAKECVDKANNQAQIAYKDIFTRSAKRTHYAVPSWEALEPSAQAIRRVDDQIEATCARLSFIMRKLFDKKTHAPPANKLLKICKPAKNN